MASVDVPDGTSFAYAIAEGSITSTPILRTSLAPTAVTDPAVLEGTVADGVLRAGQVVVSGTFVAPADVGRGSGPATFADALPEGTVAVPFAAPDLRRASCRARGSQTVGIPVGAVYLK